MKEDELIQAVTRLAAQERVLTRRSKRTCKILYSIPLPGMKYAHLAWHKPTPLPGGSRFALISESKKSLLVYDTHAGSFDEFLHLIPDQEHPIHVWKVAPMPSGELCIAIATDEALSTWVVVPDYLTSL
jgi:hypothetical protein